MSSKKTYRDMFYAMCGLINEIGASNIQEIRKVALPFNAYISQFTNLGWSTISFRVRGTSAYH